MSFSEVLTSGTVLLAFAVYALAALGEPFVEDRLGRMFKDNPPFQWGWDGFFAPLLRATMVVTFVMVAYPALFGLRVAPGVGELIAGGESRLNHLLGSMFVLTLFVPLLPVFGRRAELVLPAQGVLATAVLFHWLADYLAVTAARPWPGIDVAVLMLGVAFLAYHTAGTAGRLLGERLDRRLGTAGFETVLGNAVQLLAQAPVILIYGYALGQQLAI